MICFCGSFFLLFAPFQPIKAGTTKMKTFFCSCPFARGRWQKLKTETDGCWCAYFFTTSSRVVVFFVRDGAVIAWCSWNISPFLPPFLPPHELTEGFFFFFVPPALARFRWDGAGEIPCELGRLHHISLLLLDGNLLSGEEPKALLILFLIYIPKYVPKYKQRLYLNIKYKRRLYFGTEW